jgi:hypothetical protein
MKIEIGKPIEKEKNPKNCYKFVIGFMYGDADGYDDSEVEVSKDHPYLERFINFLERCKTFDADNSFKGLEDSWLFVPEQNWTNIPEQEKERDEADLSFDWLYDVAREGFRASFDGYEVTFFNEQGIEHEVKITK